MKGTVEGAATICAVITGMFAICILVCLLMTAPVVGDSLIQTRLVILLTITGILCIASCIVIVLANK